MPFRNPAPRGTASRKGKPPRQDAPCRGAERHSLPRCHPHRESGSPPPFPGSHRNRGERGERPARNVRSWPAAPAHRPHAADA